MIEMYEAHWHSRHRINRRVAQHNTRRVHRWSNDYMVRINIPISFQMHSARS